MSFNIYEPGTVSRSTLAIPSYNYGPGPAPLPPAVLSKINSEFFNVENSQVPVLNMSHRSPEFTRILQGSQAALRTTLLVPETHSILFLHGGGHGMFAGVPLNLLSDVEKAASGVHGEYLEGGTWTDRAMAEGGKYATVKSVEKIDRKTTAKYVYLCSNETVNGTEVRELPVLDTATLVVDMSSDICSKVIDWDRVGVGFGCTPKNIGHAGLTVAIVKTSLLSLTAQRACPGVLNWRIMHESNSVWNTPATFNIYTTKLVCEWIIEQGGVREMELRAIEKARLLYECIDQSAGFYTTVLPPGSANRSRMNIPFAVNGELCDSPLTDKFLRAAYERNIVGLLTLTPFGYGNYLRASMYNHVTVEMARHLAEFLREFMEEERGGATPTEPAAITDNSAKVEKVAVLGSGSFGSAVARMLAVSGASVTIYTRRSGVADEINQSRTNAQYTGGATFPATVTASCDLGESLANATVVVIAVPGAYLKDLLDNVKAHKHRLGPDPVVVNLVKSLHRTDDSGLSGVGREIEAALELPVASVMGPNIYTEMLEDEFAEATVGVNSGESALGSRVSALFNGPNFQTSVWEDRQAVEVCAGLKNVVALGVGFVEGMGLGSNVKSAVIRKGLKEMRVVCERMGARNVPALMLESCAVGDLVLTCTAGRGRRLAAEFVKASPRPSWEALEEKLFEGMKIPDYGNAKTVAEWTNEEWMGLPLMQAVFKVAWQGADATAVLETLRR